MSGFYFHNLEEYRSAVMDEMQELTAENLCDIESRCEENKERIIYGYKTRISASVMAAEILGIKSCGF